jgi:hypothetical protein
MKTLTAIQLLQKESRFLGMPLVDLMKDVKKHGRMMYSERVVEAVKIVAND